MTFTSFCRFEKDPSLCRQVENPKNKIEVEQDSPLTLDDNQAGKFVQIFPQRVRLKLRKSVKKTVKFQVAHAKKYPVDLYYLMDLSNSMSDDRDNIVSHKISKKQGLIEECCSIHIAFKKGAKIKMPSFFLPSGETWSQHFGSHPENHQRLPDRLREFRRQRSHALH